MASHVADTCAQSRCSLCLPVNAARMPYTKLSSLLLAAPRSFSSCMCVCVCVCVCVCHGAQHREGGAGCGQHGGGTRGEIGDRTCSWARKRPSSASASTSSTSPIPPSAHWIHGSLAKETTGTNPALLLPFEPSSCAGGAGWASVREIPAAPSAAAKKKKGNERNKK